MTRANRRVRGAEVLPAVWFVSSCPQPNIPAAVQLCLCVFVTSRSSRVTCVRAPQTRTPQADSKPHPDLCEREPAEHRQLEHAPDKIRRAVCSQWPIPSELLKITCNSNVYVVLLLKNSAWVQCLSSSSPVFGLCVSSANLSGCLPCPLCC